MLPVIPAAWILLPIIVSLLSEEGREGLERRLAAILAADVVGFARLMGEDETGTLERLKSLRKELVQPRIAVTAAASIPILISRCTVPTVTRSASAG